LIVEDSIENKLINKRNLSLIDDPTYVLTYYINFKTNNKDVATVPISPNIENYEITIKNTKTKPKMTITAKDISMTYKDKTNYNVQLIDTNGKPIPLAGETIKITIKTKEYNIKTNNNGTATLPINLNIGNYEITAKYNEKTIKNTITITKPEMTITAEDINMTYKDKTNYNVQLIDANKKPIPLAGETIKITIKTKEYNIKTNNNGTATLPINLNIGNYEITAKYNEKTIKNIIVVNKA